MRGARTQVFLLQILCSPSQLLACYCLAARSPPFQSWGRGSPNSFPPTPLPTAFSLGSANRGVFRVDWKEGERGFLPSFRFWLALFWQPVHHCCQHQPCSEVPAAATLGDSLSQPGPGSYSLWSVYNLTSVTSVAVVQYTDLSLSCLTMPSPH